LKVAADQAASGDVTRRSAIQLTGAAIALPVAQFQPIVASRSALAGSNSGRAFLAEPKRAGNFVFDSANLSAKVAIDPRQGIYVAPEFDMTGASGAWVRQFDGAVNVRWFGALADDSTDDSVAFVAALGCLEAMREVGYGYGQGSLSLFIPAGRYYLASTTLDVVHTLRIEGEGGFGPSGGASILRWDAGVTGIRLQDHDTTGATATIASRGYGANGTIIKGLLLKSAFSGTESEAHGIDVRSKAKIEDIFIDGFAGDGIHSKTSLGAAYRGNSNGSRISDVFVQNCRDGVHLEEVDTNNWTIINALTFVNRRYGIWKKTTLGCTIIGGDSSTNGTTPGFPTMTTYMGNRYYLLSEGDGTNPPSGTTADNADWGFWGLGGASTEFPAWSALLNFRAGGALRIEGSFEQNIVLGWYREPDQSPPQIEASAQTLWLSPMGGNPVQFDGTRYRGMMTGTGAGVMYPGGLYVGDQPSRGLVTLNGNVNEFIREVNTDGDAWHWDGSGRVLRLQSDNTGATAIGFTTANAGLAFGRSANVADVAYFASLAIGGLGGRIIDCLDNAPASGYHARGEVVINKGGTGGNDAIALWRCSDSGTPGTWEPVYTGNPVAAISATTTTAYSATASDHTIPCDATAGAFSVSLPAAASSAGLMLNIKKIDASPNAVMVEADGSDAIDGVTTYVLQSQWDSVTVHCNGTEWFVL
jgi:hypothetical protein